MFCELLRRNPGVENITGPTLLKLCPHGIALCPQRPALLRGLLCLIQPLPLPHSQHQTVQLVCPLHPPASNRCVFSYFQCVSWRQPVDGSCSLFYYTIQQSLPFAWSASLFPCNRIIIIVKSFLRFFFNVRHFLKSLLNLLQYCFSFVLGVLVTKTCGIPNQGLKLHPLHWKEKSFFVILFLSLLFFCLDFLFCFVLEGKILTTGPPGKSQCCQVLNLSSCYFLLSQLAFFPFSFSVFFWVKQYFFYHSIFSLLLAYEL